MLDGLAVGAAYRRNFLSEEASPFVKLSLVAAFTTQESLFPRHLSPEEPLCLLVAVEGADVVASAGHGPGMYRCHLNQVVCQVAGRVETTAMDHAVADEWEVGASIHSYLYNR